MTTYHRYLEENTYCTGTKVSAKAAGEIAPKVHGADKPLDPNLKPEYQDQSTRVSKVTNASPQKAPPATKPSPSVSLSPPMPSPTNHGGARPKDSSPVVPPRCILAPLVVKPPPPNPFSRDSIAGSPIGRGEDVDDEEIEQITTKYVGTLNPRPTPGIDTGVEEELLDPEMRFLELPDFVPPISLDKIVDLSKVTYKFLPKQGEIDRLLKQIERKVLRDINLSNELKDLKAAYLTSPHFKDIYLNLMQNKVPLNTGVARRMERSVRDYLTLDGLLFKIIPCGRHDYETVLCIPLSKVYILMDMHHSSITGVQVHHPQERSHGLLVCWEFHMI